MTKPFVGLRLFDDARGRRLLAYLKFGVVELTPNNDDRRRTPGFYSMDWEPVPSPVNGYAHDAEWTEGKHPRGQPGNKGQFAKAPGGGGAEPEEAPAEPAEAESPAEAPVEGSGQRAPVMRRDEEEAWNSELDLLQRIAEEPLKYSKEALTAWKDRLAALGKNKGGGQLPQVVQRKYDKFLKTNWHKVNEEIKRRGEVEAPEQKKEAPTSPEAPTSLPQARPPVSKTDIAEMKKSLAIQTQQRHAAKTEAAAARLNAECRRTQYIITKANATNRKKREYGPLNAESTTDARLLSDEDFHDKYGIDVVSVGGSYELTVTQRKAWLNMPPEHRELLADRVTTFADESIDLSGIQTTMGHGGRYTNVAGLFNATGADHTSAASVSVGYVTVADWCGPKNSRWTANSEGVATHEFGHAMDKALGEVSDMALMHETLTHLQKTLPPEIKSVSAYYLKLRSELFAEGYNLAFGRTATAFGLSRDTAQKYFGSAAAAVKELINKRLKPTNEWIATHP